jgi:hypothetical protein
MPLEIQPIPGQPGLFRREGLGGIFDLPGTEAVKLINRRKVLRKNWMNLRGQLGRAVKPPPGISQQLFDAASRAFNDFITWDDGIGTLKEIGGAYESEVVDQEAIYDMYSNQVAQALKIAGAQPTFTTGIPRPAAAPTPTAPVQAGVMPYPLPDPEKPKWGTVEYVLITAAVLSFLFIVADLRKPWRWEDEDVDIPEVRPPKGARALRPERAPRYEERPIRYEEKRTAAPSWGRPTGPVQVKPERRPSYPTYTQQPILEI